MVRCVDGRAFCRPARDRRRRRQQRGRARGRISRRVSGRGAGDRHHGGDAARRAVHGRRRTRCTSRTATRAGPGTATCSPSATHVDAGVGFMLPYFKRTLGGTPLEHHTRFLEEAGALGIVRGRSNPANFKAYRLPLGGPLARTFDDRVLLCGDAGGFVNAYTGEGIYHAMVTGPSTRERSRARRWPPATSRPSGWRTTSGAGERRSVTSLPTLCASSGGSSPTRRWRIRSSARPRWTRASAGSSRWWPWGSEPAAAPVRADLALPARPAPDARASLGTRPQRTAPGLSGASSPSGPGSPGALPRRDCVARSYRRRGARSTRARWPDGSDPRTCHPRRCPRIGVICDEVVGPVGLFRLHGRRGGITRRDVTVTVRAGVRATRSAQRVARP